MKGLSGVCLVAVLLAVIATGCASRRYVNYPSGFSYEASKGGQLVACTRFLGRFLRASATKEDPLHREDVAAERDYLQAQVGAIQAATPEKLSDGDLAEIYFTRCLPADSLLRQLEAWAESHAIVDRGVRVPPDLLSRIDAQWAKARTNIPKVREWDVPHAHYANETAAAMERMLREARAADAR